MSTHTGNASTFRLGTGKWGEDVLILPAASPHLSPPNLEAPKL